MRYLLALLIVLPVRGALLYLESSTWGNFTTLSNIIQSASDGDRLIFGPGTNTYNGQSFNSPFVSPTPFNSLKSISIIGCGTNQTRWIFTNIGTAINIVDATNTPFVISDIYIDAAPSFNTINIGYTPPSTVDFPAYVGINRCIFMLRGGRTLFVGGGDSYGYVANTKFLKPPGVAIGGNHAVVLGNQYLSWDNAIPIGTTNMWYFEDCYFFSDKIGGNTYPSNGQIDGYNGGSGSWRHTMFDGPSNNGFHGYDSQVTSIRYTEFLENTFTNMTSDAYPMLTRGGVMNVISNQVYSSGSTNISSFGLQYFRTAWGAYQEATASQAADRTNAYTGTVLSATGTSITVTNVPYFGPQYRFDAADGTSPSVRGGWPGWALSIVGGTGAGQSRIVTTTTISGNQVSPSTVTFNVSSAWSVNPDATSTFQLCPTNGVSVQVGNQPNYLFTVSTTLNQNRQVHVATNLDGTLDAATTFGNWKACINGEAGLGTKYFYTAIEITRGNSTNYDLYCTSATTNQMVLTSLMDGGGTLRYPGTQQEGVISVTKGSSNGVVTWPCISMSNYVNGTTPVGFVLLVPYDPIYPFYNTNSVLAGRDYYETNGLNFTPQPYPLPLRSVVYATNSVLTITPSGATPVPTLTTTEDIFAGTGAGARTYQVGQYITNTAPATSGSYNFVQWNKNGSLYTTNTTMTFTNDAAWTFAAVYAIPAAPTQVGVQLNGTGRIGTGRAILQ